MVNNYNTSISKRATDMLNVRDGQFFDNNLGNKIVPVLEINRPVVNVLASNVVINGTSATIYTTPTDKDFYLTSAQLSVIKDATSTSTACTISATVGGVTTQILTIKCLTLTAQENSISNSFYYPIKIDRGTNIVVTSTTNVANVGATGNIQGYLSDTLQY